MATSTIAIDVSTGRIKGHHQYNPNDSWDWDEVSPPILVDYQRQGRTIKGLIDVARDKDSYLASMDGLPYGEDPSEGYVRGRRFLHPRLGFTFTAPDRFTLENTAQAVLGVRDSANLALRTTGDRWVPQVITFAPEIFSPDVDLQKTAVDVNGGQLLAGDVVEYTI